jgi:putative copper resistance protein D
MFYATVAAEALLYVVFAILTGYFLLQIRPADQRPAVFVPPVFLYGAVAALPVLAFFPVLRIVFYLGEQIGFWTTLQSVLWTFDIGTAWVLTAILSLFLLMFTFIGVKQNRTAMFYAALICLFLLVMTIGWSSHASSLSFWKGFIGHTLHFLAVIIWTGILLNAAFFVKEPANWLSFLQWFTPLAVGCVIVLSISGFMIMDTIIPYEQYAAIWPVSYGQTLLMKHLVFLPVLLFAVMNGILTRRMANMGTSINPLPWLRAEAVLLLLVFTLTGLLGQQSPPHDLETMIRTDGASPVFEALYNGTIPPDMRVELNGNLHSLSFGMIALIFAFLLIAFFLKKAPAAAALFLSLLFAAACYMSLMYSVQ